MKIESTNSGLSPVISIPESFPSDQQLWFLIEEKNVPKPMMAIHVINGSQVRRGTVLFSNALEGVSFTQEQHVGFLRWFKDDFKVQKMSVSDGWDKTTFSQLLIDAANSFISLSGIEATIKTAK